MRLQTIKAAMDGRGWFLFGVGTAIMGVLFYTFTDFELIVGNFGMAFALTNLILEVALAPLFGLNLALLWHKHFSLATKQGSAAMGGGFLAALVAGCPACSLSFASFLGLGSIVALYPTAGLWLKLTGLLLLGYSIYSLSDPTCKLNFRNS